MDAGRASTERQLQGTDSQSIQSSLRQDSNLRRRDNISKPTFHGGIYDPNSNDTTFLLPYIEDPDKRQKLEQLEMRILNKKFNQGNNNNNGQFITEVDNKEKSQDLAESTSIIEKMIPVKFQNLRIVSE